MKSKVRLPILVGSAFLALAVAGAYAEMTTPASMADSPLILTAPEALAVAEFEVNLKHYLAMHQKLEATFPALPKQATPEQVDKNQRALGTLITAARVDAKQGDFFTPAIQAVARRALVQALAGPDGKASRESILDENTNVANIVLNDRYPDTIPLSTMPLLVLEVLPKLSEGLEYRFIGERLVLLDTHANLIIDFTDNILP